MQNHLKIIEFMKIVEKLCLVERDNLMSTGRQETDSDHIIKLSYLVMMVYPYLKTKVDYTKMLEMALIHDLVEARSGDYSLSAQTANPDLKEQKKKAEADAAAYYQSILPPPLNDKIYDIFMEYEQRQSMEAKILWCLDKLEANLQANQFRNGDVHYWADCENGNWYYTCAVTKKPQIQEIDEDILKDLEQAIIKISEENIAKCGIKTCV